MLATARAGSVKINGLRELQRALRHLPDEVTGELKVLHADTAKIVERRARQLVPVRSGRLRASLRSTGQKKTGVVRAGKKAVPYAGPIHWGWPARNIKPNEFLVDALADKAEDVADEMYRGLDRLIGRAMSSLPK